MAQQALRAGVRAVKSNRKFVARKAAIVMVSREKLVNDIAVIRLLLPSFQTPAAVNQVRRLLQGSNEAVSV